MPTPTHQSRRPRGERPQSKPPTRSKKKPGDKTVVQRQILKGLRVPIEKNRPSIGYRLALTLVGVTMLLWPVIYLALIGLFGYTVWWNWVHAQATDEYLSYLFVFFGVVAIVFLLKPLFTRNASFQRPSRLKREAEPFLFEYVDAICDAVNAPKPSEIRVDCDANASASLTNGLWSAFTGDLTLTIGLPLVAGLSVREFTGVLAHEFGHFSQGYGMRLTAVIRSINFWFFKAAYERDAWDERLASLSQALPVRIGIFVYAARGLVWLARKFIAFLAVIGHGISCAMLRQMEYDADRYETRLVGTTAFMSTCRKLTPLGLAHSMAMSDAESFYREGRLADEFPKLVVSNVSRIPSELTKRIRKNEREQTTAWFDSHPTNRDRVAASKAIAAKGAFLLSDDYSNVPASVIFSEFTSVSRGATFRLYRALLGEHFEKEKLRRTDSLIQRRDAEQEAGKSLDRYFQTHIPVLRPLRLAADATQPPPSGKAALARLKTCRAEMLTMVDEYETLAKCLDEAELSWLLAAEADSLLASQISFKAKEFRLPSNEPRAVKTRLQQTEAAVQKLSMNMMPFEDHAEERLTCALRLLQVPAVSERIPKGNELAGEIAQLIPDAKHISGLMSEIPDLRLGYRRLGTMLGKLDTKERPALYQQIDHEMRAMYGVLKAMRKRMAKRMYPLDHADDVTTLADFALPDLPDPNDIFGIAFVTRELFERLAEIQIRLFAKLAHAAERVETAVGLPPLKERETPDED